MMRRAPEDHLTEEELVAFIVEDLPEPLCSLIDRHLAGCEGCARQLEAFFSSSEQFPEPAWARSREDFATSGREGQFASSMRATLPGSATWRGIAKIGEIVTACGAHIPRMLLPLAAGLLVCAVLVFPTIVNRHPALVRMTSDAGLTKDPFISRDGSTLVYASDRGGKGNLEIWAETIATSKRSRITNNSADDYSPSIAQGWIAFRSDRGNGGVYKVRATGGDETLVAEKASGPRISPDGNWIAYWTGDAFSQAGAIFVVSMAGGEPVNVCPSCAHARYPVWSDDSRHILFRGALKTPDGREGITDFWVTTLEQGIAMKAPVQTGARELLDREGIHSGTPMPPPQAWVGEEVFFTAGVHPANAWKARVVPGTFRITDSPIPLTFGASDVGQVSVGPDDELYFSGIESSTNIVSLPIDANRGRILGPLSPLTSDSATNIYPSVSRDGLKLAFASDRGKTRAIWLLDLTSGEYRQLAPSSSVFDSPKISPDGSRVAFAVTDLRKPLWTLKSVATTGEAEPVTLASTGNTGPPKDWSANGSRVLVENETAHPENRIGGGILDTNSKEYCLIQPPGYSVIPNSFSPDSQWVAFHTRDRTVRTLWIAKLTAGCWPDQKQWIRAVSQPSANDREARWSPDGNTIYFLSERDGFRCIWGQRLDAMSKMPAGDTFEVQHFHSSAASLLKEEGPAVVGPAVLPNQILFSLRSMKGNIWVAHLSPKGFRNFLNIP